MRTIDSNIIYTLLIITFLLSSACTKHNSKLKLKLNTIHFEECIKKEQGMKISEIAESIEYLELKTPHDIVISRILNIVLGDGFWLIHTRQGIYKFTRTGEFVKQIGRQGQGPDEYLYILGIDINPTRKEIIHADTQHILYYDYNGNFLRKVKINDYFFNIVFSDSVLWTCNLCMHIDKYMACALNLTGDTVTAVPNPNYGIESLNEGFSFATSSELREFSKYKENVYMKTRSSRDTVYQLSGTQWIPYLYLDMGKYQMPIEYEAWYSEDAYNKNAINYWNIPRLEEDDRYFFFTAVRQKYIQKGENENDCKFIIYDKKAKEGFVVKDENGMKITDDILGGPNFWPRWSTDNFYITTMEWSDLEQWTKEEKHILSPTLQEQFETWGEDTNQLIVLCKKIIFKESLLYT